MTVTETVFIVLEVLGTIAFAVSGAMVALQRRLDGFGVLFLGLTTALGGGCLRDVLLGRIPSAMFSHPLYAVVALATFLWQFPVFDVFFSRTGTSLDAILHSFSTTGYIVTAVCGVAAIGMGWFLLRRLSI